MLNKQVCILDYGSGNVRSVYNLFCSINETVVVSNEPSDIFKSSHLVLPGVGAFGTTMEKINKNLPIQILENEVIHKSKPFLGICVGMQVLASSGSEFGVHKGLNWIAGNVDELEADSLPLPHVGWNDILPSIEDPLMQGLDNHMDFYFVHKYVFKPENPNNVVARTHYGTDFCSIIRDKNIVGVQFHPEKSQQAGKKLALNFLAMS